MNDKLQGDNVDDELRQRLNLPPGAPAAAAGNPIDKSYDWSATLGGPILRDKVWFFSSFRWFRLDQFQIGAVNPDGSLGIDDNRIRAGMGKVTYQASPSAKFSYLMIPHLKERFHRRNAPYLAIPDKATVNNPLDTDSCCEYNGVLGKALLVDVSFGRVWGLFANHYQPEVGLNDITVDDTNTFVRINAATDDQNNPNHRNQLNASLSYFDQNPLGGSHTFKFGGQMSREQMLWEKFRNGDITLNVRDGVGYQALLANTPNTTDHRINSWGLFAQDGWTFGRTVLNLGVRLDAAESNLPAQSSAAGNWVGARASAKTQVFDFPLNVGPRLGVSYDLFGHWPHRVKAYYGRFYISSGPTSPRR
jgi:hypothetical protein